MPRNPSQISKSQACVDMGQGEIRQRNGDQGRKPATFRPYRVRCSAIHGYCLRALLVRTKMRSVFAAAPPAGTFLPFPCRILRVQGGARKFYREAAPIGVNNPPLSKPQACVTVPSGANFPKINKPKFSASSAPRRRLSRKNSPSSPRPICFSGQKKSNETNHPKENIGKEKSFACQKSRNVVK